MCILLWKITTLPLLLSMRRSKYLVQHSPTFNYLYTANTKKANIWMFYFKIQEEEHAWSTLNFNTEVNYLVTFQRALTCQHLRFYMQLTHKTAKSQKVFLDKKSDITSLVDMQMHVRIVRASEKCPIITFIDVDIRHRMEPLFEKLLSRKQTFIVGISSELHNIC